MKIIGISGNFFIGISITISLFSNGIVLEKKDPASLSPTEYPFGGFSFISNGYFLLFISIFFFISEEVKSKKSCIVPCSNKPLSM